MDNATVLTLAMGGGLDRHTGPMVDQGSSLIDLRNMVLGRGFAYVRAGATEISTFSESVVCAIAPLPSERVSIAVAYDAGTRDVNVYRLTAGGESPALIGKWFTLHAQASAPPRVFAAEAGGLLFLAHDEPSPTRRAPTVYYNPATAFLHTLTADWVQGDDNIIRFRGVVPHLTHLAGWGFGDGAEHGPHIVRHSLPGQPSVFEFKHYMVVGQRGDPIMACAQAAGTLHVFKASQRWEFVGTSRLDFDVVLVDELFGLIASRAFWVLQGEIIFWSHAGPRSCTRGPSVDIAQPLGLEFPEPADLPALGDINNAFAAYLPTTQVVEFNFARRAYALSLVPERRWGYYERGFTPFCAGLLFPDDVLGDLDPGYATGLAVVMDVPSATAGKRDVTVQWNNTDMVGDEVLELWLRQDGGAWAEFTTALVGAAATQQKLLAALEPGVAYELQIRARRGGEYRDDYEDADPSNWPADSYLAFTTEIPAPGIEAVWSRTSATQEKIAVTITPVAPDLDVELYRDDGAGGAFALLETITPAMHNGAPYTYDDLSDDEGLADPNTEWGERTYRYRARTIGESANSDYAELACWAGPPAPTAFVVTPDPEIAYTVNATWIVGDAAAVTDLEDNFMCLSAFAVNDTYAAGVDEAQLVHVGNGSPAPPTTPLIRPTSFRIRHRRTQFTVEDFSDYALHSIVDVVGEDSESGTDGYNTCP